MSGGETMRVLEVLLALAWLAIGVFLLAMAAQARRRGSSAKTWLVPAAGGTLFILWGLFLLWGWAA